MLDPWFITGFTDGEGCFSLFVRADRQKRLNTVKVYYRWQVDFAYTLRGDDEVIQTSENSVTTEKRNGFMDKTSF